MYGAIDSTSGKNIDEADALLSPHPSLRRWHSRRRPSYTSRSPGVLKNIYSTDINGDSIDASRTRESEYSFVYTLLNPRSRQWQAVAYKSFISTIILADLCLFIISTDNDISKRHQDTLYIIEGVVSCLFLLEYTARLVTVTEGKRYGKLGPVWGRLSYLFSWGALIDFMATIPFFLEILTGWNLPTLTHLRFFRLFRILKTEGYVKAIDAVYRVIYYNRQILYVALLVCCFLVLLTAFLLYYLRPPEDPENAESFSSILATLYLSTLMLTGQGGPEGDLPWYTKCVVILNSVFSVAMFAIPASMLTWGFEAEAARCAKLSWRQAKKNSKRCPSSSSSSQGSDNSTDEEYFKIIAGEEEEKEEDDAAKAWLHAQKLSFQRADVDRSGTISLQEYIEMQRSRDNERGGESITVERIEELERKLNCNCEKLDKILELLQKNM